MKTKLNKACYNSNGYFDVSPGTDMLSKLSVSTSTVQRYIDRGWLKRVGNGLVLTQKGYNEC